MKGNFGLESGPTSVWLWRELAKRGLPVTCIDARHAKAALLMQINKSDRNDAAGIARIMQTGWYREVQVKSPHSHAIRGLLNSRSLLVKVQRDLENQVRGLLKSAGLIVGRAKDGVFNARTKQLLAAHIDLAAIALPLLEAREAIHQQQVQLERRVRQLAKEHRQTSAFMTVPGIGPMTALAFLLAVLRLFQDSTLDTTSVDFSPQAELAGPSCPESSCSQGGSATDQRGARATLAVRKRPGLEPSA